MTALALVLTAGFVAAVDLGYKAIALNGPEPVVGHERPFGYIAAGATAATIWAIAIVFSRSVPIALAGGIAVGGAVANLTSLALWPSFAGVPDPIVAGRIAFNVADVAVGVGLLLVVATTVVFAVRNRSRLREPVRLRA